MVRTKQTAGSIPEYRPAVGEIARFEPREIATPPNIMQCSKCEKCFSSSSNLRRHEKQICGTSVFKYACPLSPTRQYARRANLRDHFREKHPEADEEEIDLIEPVETTKEQPKNASVKRPAGETTSSSLSPEKVKGQRPTTVEVVSVEGHSSGLPTPAKMEQVAPGAGRRLTKVVETVKITVERVYTFEVDH